MDLERIEECIFVYMCVCETLIQLSMCICQYMGIPKIIKL